MKLKTIILSLAAIAVTSVSAKDYKYQTFDNDLLKTRIYTLDNGLKVYLSVNDEKPRIQTYIAVRTGSKNDPAETTGLAHYLEHLMFKGTSRFGVTDPAAEKPYLDKIQALYEEYRTLTDAEARRQKYHEIDSLSQLAAQYFIPNEYDKLMSIIGAQGTNAYTSNDVTCYTEDIPSNEVENWAKIQGERFQNMTIRGFHTELEAVYEEYNIHLSYDSDKQFDALMSKLYPNHPYGTQTTIGTQEHLKNPSITNIKNYFSKWYVPNNVAICMAGDLNPDEVIAIIDKYFGSWKPGNDVAQPTFPALQPITAPIDTTVVGLEAENIWLGWRFDKAASLQNDTLKMVRSILYNGTAGLIDLDIVQKMKMLSAYSLAESMMDHSFLVVLGTPKEGQTLDDVKALLLAEVDKLRRGDFPDDLVQSVINNYKLNYYNSLESNSWRANEYVESFINGEPWEQHVGRFERFCRLTKKDVVDFANRHLLDNYVAVYKRQGNDTTQKKIDKPAITPIPTNRDLMSQFVKDIKNTKVKPIEPRFVDFKKDLTFAETKKKLPMLYVKNTENGRFQLNFKYDLGQENDVRYDYAAEYIKYLGTDKLSAEQLKQQFYKLACECGVSVEDREMYVYLNGLSENMPQALALLEDLLQNAKVDNEAYEKFIGVLEKTRQDNKLNQSYNFYYLINYGMYGPRNSMRDALSAEQLRKINPQTLLDMLKNLSQYKHEVHYYGPMSVSDVSKIITKEHRMAKDLIAAPEARHYTSETTPENEVLIAPYDAKNIYMRMVHNEKRQWHPEEAAVQSLFNEYYGGGMNTIVFQELREARGLAYNAYAAYVRPDYKDQSEYFFTHIITQNDKMMDCVRQFHSILDTIPQSDAAFAIAKDALTKRLASRRVTKFGIINAWLNAQNRGIDYDINERIYNALPGIQLKDIVDFEQKNIANKPYRYVILGDEKELDIKALEKIAPIKRLTTEEIFGY